MSNRTWKGLGLALVALAAAALARADGSLAPDASGVAAPPSAPKPPFADAESLARRARLRLSKRDIPRALELMTRAIEVGERAVGRFGEKLLPLYKELSLVHMMRGDHLRVAEVAERTLAIAERVFGKTDPRLVTYLDGAATSARILGDQAGALVLYERTLALVRKSPKPDDHPQLPGLLASLGMMRALAGQWKTADALLREYIAHAARKWGKQSSLYYHALDMYGAMLEQRHDFGAAERVYRIAYDGRVRRSGADHLDVAPSLIRLAWIDVRRGDLTRAEATFQRVLGLYAKAGPNYREAVAAFYEQLGYLYLQKKDAAKAKAVYDKAEVIRAAAFAEHEKKFAGRPEVLGGLIHIVAGHYRQRGELAKAEPLLRRALALAEQSGDPRSLAVMNASLLLGNCAEARKNDAEAEKLYLRAVAIYESKLGTRTPSGLHFLGNLYERGARFAEAEKIQRRILTGYGASFGPKHVIVGHAHQRIALLRWAQDDAADAVVHLRDAEEVFEANLRLVLGAGLEKDKRRFLEQLGAMQHVDHAVSFQLGLGKGRNDAAAHALTVLLRRKGRVLDAMADAIGAARRRATPEVRKKLARLARKRALLARLVTRGKGAGETIEAHVARVAALEDEVRGLENELVAASPVLRASAEAVTVDAVRARIPKDARLVELVLFHPRSPKTGDHLPDRPIPDARYAAYVVGPDGFVASVDLGPAAAIDGRIRRMRAALSDPSRDGARARARALAKKLLWPIEPHIAKASHLFLSPDGALNLVPFAALPLPDGQYLLKRHRLSYLTSGRDLLRLQLGVRPKSGATVLAAPDFGTALAAKDEGPAGEGEPAAGGEVDLEKLDFSSKVRGVRSIDLGSMQWSPLPGTAAEAESLRALLPDATVLVGEAATEAAIKAVRAPRLLHVATHGFFLPREAPSGAPDAAPENPLLRSGLVFAGANARASAEEDGVLTALEASSLDLYGTELVVLSACETGLGDVEAGDGVYGLRRALVVAGAESQVMTLWRVDDAASRALMEAFYKRLRAGQGRAEAMRGAQLELMDDPKRAHPFYWAAFIQSGAWSPLRAASEAQAGER